MYVVGTFEGQPAAIDRAGSIGMVIATCGVEGDAKKIVDALNAQRECPMALVPPKGEPCRGLTP